MIKKADVRNTRHTAPESVKKVKSIKQILVKNKMEAERLSQCWQKTLPKKFKPSWMPVKNGVLWWPELPPNAFVAFNLQKNDLPTIFVRYFLLVRSSVRLWQLWLISAMNTWRDPYQYFSSKDFQIAVVMLVNSRCSLFYGIQFNWDTWPSWVLQSEIVNLKFKHNLSIFRDSDMRWGTWKSQR